MIQPRHRRHQGGSLASNLLHSRAGLLQEAVQKQGHINFSTDLPARALQVQAL